MARDFQYKGDYQKCLSFPLGGIGSGSIGLGGNGRLTDWEIFNRPGKGRLNGMTHFSLKVEEEGKVIGARILNGDLQAPYEGVYGTNYFFEGFGWGPRRETMAGMPHFTSNSFRGTFPIARLDFEDEKFPGKVSMEAFNPFIPHNENDSSIPAAFFSFTISNTGQKERDYYLTGVLGNPYKGKTRNCFYSEKGLSFLTADSRDYASENIDAGDMSLVTDGDDVSYQEYLYRGEWFDALEVYWKDLMTPGPFKNRHYEPADRNVWDNGLVSSKITLQPGGEKIIRFLISWNHPVNRNTWHKGNENLGSWKNYYASLWKNSKESAVYAMENWNRLIEETSRFRNTLFSSSLPESVLDAVASNLAVLKSSTVWRLEDGTLYGWEGVGERAGSCEGSCTHVWGYTQALPFLFPALSRSMREAEFKYNWADDGSMTFRLMLPVGAPRWQMRPAADGFLVTLMKTFREWKICGDDKWLKSLWPRIGESYRFIWSKDNQDLWDPNRSGILTGRQHHTLDMELFGPNAWLSGMYLGALKAGIEMARAVGDEDMEKICSKTFEKGCKTLNENLFNGEHYIQKIDLTDKGILKSFIVDDDHMITRDGGGIEDVYWSDELGQLKYQIGGGSSIDQLLGQWHSDIYGLGDIFDRKQTEKALDTMMKLNFREVMRDHYNPCRIYCLNDESGLAICAWANEEDRPAIPVPYSQETMHGFEYAAADLMIRRGREGNGLKIVKSIRDRYDGRRRNPWNEMECGSNYARSMASYALLLTYSGFTFDGRKNHLGFHPLKEGDVSFFWSCGTGWGRFSRTGTETTLYLAGGNLTLDSLEIPASPGKKVTLNSSSIGFEVKGEGLFRIETLFMKEGDSLVIDPNRVARIV